MLLSVKNTGFSSYLTSLTLDSTQCEAIKHFLDKDSSELKKPTVCGTQDLRLRGTFALWGEILMAFLGKESERDCGFSEYLGPNSVTVYCRPKVVGS